MHKKTSEPVSQDSQDASAIHYLDVSGPFVCISFFFGGVASGLHHHHLWVRWTQCRDLKRQEGGGGGEENATYVIFYLFDADFSSVLRWRLSETRDCTSRERINLHLDGVSQSQLVA